MEKENRFAENLRSLRDYWGETQDDFREAIACGKAYSRSLISKWENGTGKPDNDTLVRIAAHYQVSIDQLLYEDLSEIGKMSFRADKNSLSELSRIALPYVTSSEAETDPLFYKAFVMMKRLWSKFGSTVSEWTLPEIYSLYYDSYQKNATIEAVCNMVSCLMAEWAGIVSKTVAERMDRLPNNTELVTGLLKNISLGQVELFTPEEMSIRREYIVATADTFDEHLAIIKKSSKWADFADYYLGLRYLLGFVDNTYDFHTNVIIGIEMLEQFAKWGNPYALCYFEQQYKMSTHSDDE